MDFPDQACFKPEVLHVLKKKTNRKNPQFRWCPHIHQGCSLIVVTLTLWLMPPQVTHRWLTRWSLRSPSRQTVAFWGLVYQKNRISWSAEKRFHSISRERAQVGGEPLPVALGFSNHLLATASRQLTSKVKVIPCSLLLQFVPSCWEGSVNLISNVHFLRKMWVLSCQDIPSD